MAMRGFTNTSNPFSLLNKSTLHTKGSLATKHSLSLKPSFIATKSYKEPLENYIEETISHYENKKEVSESDDEEDDD